MSLYIPSFSEIMAVSQSRGADSEAPDLWRGLVGWWPLQEPGGATAFDASGWRRNGTWAGAGTHHGVGRLGRCGTFNGSNDYISGSIYIPAGSFTFACWFRTASISAYQVLLGSSSAYRVVLGFGNTSGEFLLYGNGVNQSSSAGVTTDWQHVALTRTGASTYNLYRNTKLVWTFSDAYAFAAPLLFGCRNNAAEPGYNFLNGSIVPPVIYSRALLPFENQQLYTDPWAMGTLRRRVFPAATAATTPIVLNILLAHGLYVGSQA